MGSYDGAETYELVGSFLLSQLQDLNANIGLYRDDGLAITNAPPRETENIRKEICRIFNNNGLRITIEANKQIINFVEVTFKVPIFTHEWCQGLYDLSFVHKDKKQFCAPSHHRPHFESGLQFKLTSDHFIVRIAWIFMVWWKIKTNVITRVSQGTNENYK